MKHILALLLICSSFIVKAQVKSDKLVGTWELTGFSFSGNALVDAKSNGFKRYKSFTPTHFIVTDVDPKSNVTKTSIFGTYSLADSTYTEHLLHVNKENANMIGSDYPGIIKFDSDNEMQFATQVNGQKMVEYWKKAKAE